MKIQFKFKDTALTQAEQQAAQVTSQNRCRSKMLPGPSVRHLHQGNALRETLLICN
jgi:hypothetical protein